MKSVFGSEFFVRNRQRLRELCEDTELIVITANGQLQRSGDSTFPFQQDANFRYLTGLNHPDMVLVIDDRKEYLILPQRSEYQDVFDGRVNEADLHARSGIADIVSFDEGWQRLSARLKKIDQVATIAASPQYVDVYGMYTNPARSVLGRMLHKQNDKLELIDISTHLADMRVIKQPEEIMAISRAIAITSDSLAQLKQPTNLKKYTYEYEVDADLTRLFRRAGSQHAFDPIIASGVRACTLHNTDMQGELLKGDLLLFDVGAEYEGYAADITRTVAITKPSKRQRQVFDAVLAVQAFAYEVLKPGITMQDYEKQVEFYMGEKLRELGLIRSIDTDTVRAYYPHATSHHLGLNVHDVGSRAAPLMENMVLTVEPGIYIPEEGIGVRIEDDVRITQTGIEILTNALPAKML